MPLRDWTDDRGFDSLHSVWQNQILYWIVPRLPPGYRAYIGGVPSLTLDSPNGRPDLGVRNWTPTAEAVAPSGATATLEPDSESVISFQIDPMRAVHIDLHGVLIAAVELISPRNKDRPSTRATYASRYSTYLQSNVHLMLIDILPRPVGYSFADTIATELTLNVPPTPPPYAMSYRVGEPVPEGTLFAHWRRPLTVGQPLPTLPLPLNVHQQVLIDLEQTYNEASRWVYL